MTFLLSWSSASALVAELVGVTQQLAVKEVTGEPADLDLNRRFVELMTLITEYTQKGMQK